MKKIKIEQMTLDKIILDYKSGMNLNSLVQKHDIGRKIIKKYLTDLGIELETKSQILEKTLNLNELILRKLYECDLLSINEIAIKFNTNSQVIKTAFKKYKIISRNSAESKTLKHLIRIPQLNDETSLKDLYIKQKKSVEAIAKLLNCSDTSVKAALIKFSIKLRNHNEACANNKSTSEQQINARLGRNLRTRLWIALEGKSKMASAVNDLGCSIEELKEKFKVLFYKNGETNEEMTWGNYGKWEIDHIIPLVNFNLSIKEEQQKACHFSNLQPSWRAHNRAKSDFIIGIPPNKVKMFLVIGQAGSGKSWVCDQLNDINYISFDTIPKEQHYHYMVEYSKNGKPIIYDPFRKVSTIYNRYCMLFDMQVILISETKEVILERLKNRGSKCTEQDVLDARKHINGYKKIANFIGTSDEVLSHLSNILRV